MLPKSNNNKDWQQLFGNIVSIIYKINIKHLIDSQSKIKK